MYFTSLIVQVYQLTCFDNTSELFPGSWIEVDFNSCQPPQLPPFLTTHFFTHKLSAMWNRNNMVVTAIPTKNALRNPSIIFCIRTMGWSVRADLNRHFLLRGRLASYLTEHIYIKYILIKIFVKYL